MNEIPLLVNSLINKSEIQENITDLITTIKKYPRDKDIDDSYYSLGYLYTQLQNYQQATESFNQVIKRDPKNATAYYWRGFSYYRLKNYKQAELDFDVAIRLNPSFINAYMNRSILNYTLGKYKQAINDANKVIDRIPKRTNISAVDLNFIESNSYLIRGNSYEKLGNKNRALKDYELTNGYEPISWGQAGDGGSTAEDPQNLYNRGSLFAKRKRNRDKAIKILERAADLFKARKDKAGLDKTLKLLAKLNKR